MQGGPKVLIHFGQKSLPFAFVQTVCLNQTMWREEAQGMERGNRATGDSKENGTETGPFSKRGRGDQGVENQPCSPHQVYRSRNLQMLS